MDSVGGLKEVYICTKSIKHFHIFNLYIYIYYRVSSDLENLEMSGNSKMGPKSQGKAHGEYRVAEQVSQTLNSFSNC